MHPFLSDPWIAAQIDAAVEPYRGKWTEQQIEIFREKAALVLATHPNAKRLLAEEHKLQIDESGERAVGGAKEEKPGAKGRRSKAG